MRGVSGPSHEQYTITAFVAIIDETIAAGKGPTYAFTTTNSMRQFCMSSHSTSKDFIPAIAGGRQY
jgi:hypothetical protein